MQTQENLEMETQENLESHNAIFTVTLKEKNFALILLYYYW